MRGDCLTLSTGREPQVSISPTTLDLDVVAVNFAYRRPKRRNALVRWVVTHNRSFSIWCPLLRVGVFLAAGFATAQSKKASKYACSEPNPAQLCDASNTCGSASTPCEVDVKRTSNGASSTPGIPNAKSNKLFCVTAGTTVTWKSTSKNIGFVVDTGTTSPFEPAGAIIGGSDRSVSVVAKTAGCYKYSAGACASGAIYGMCKETSAELVVIGSK